MRDNYTPFEISSHIPDFYVAQGLVTVVVDAVKNSVRLQNGG